MENLLKRPACNMNFQAGLCHGSFVGKAKMPARKITNQHSMLGTSIRNKIQYAGEQLRWSFQCGSVVFSV